jgi:pimeloyl-ACP methyl ester carboxylesterase
MPTVLATHEWSPAGTDPTAPVAPVALLVHGITGWWRTWWRVGPALADRGWRVIAIDQRGHGGSPAIEGRATGETLASDIGATLDDLGVASVDLAVAHSLGAAVCMGLVNGRPEVVRRLAVEDPPGNSRVDDTEFQARLAAEIRAARTSPESEVRRELAENPAWLEEDARQNVEGRAACDMEGILASLRGGTGLRVVELAPKIRIPMIYLLADEARSALGARRSALIASLPSNATLVEFDSGHTVHRDRFDEYVAALWSWLGDG